MNDKIVVNVAFNITNPLHDLIIKTSLEIRDKYSSDWYVDDERYHLHYPLYLFAAPARNEPKIIEASKNFAKSIKPVEIGIENLIFNLSGLIMIKLEDNKAIYDYHLKSLKIFNPIREGYLRDKYENPDFRKSFSKADNEKLDKYGHIYVLDRFEPHITIARIKDPDLCQKIANKYRKRLVGQKSTINRLQIHKALFGPEDKTVLLVDELLK